MIRAAMLSLVLFLALMPIGIIEKTGASQSDFEPSSHTGSSCQ
jgi:hypothetical protein